MDLCKSRSLMCSPTSSSFTKVFFAPAFLLGFQEKSLGFLRLILQLNTEVNKALSASAFWNERAQVFGSLFL